MEIRAILFLILNAHTCTAIFNVSTEDSLADTAATVEPINPPDQEKHQAAAGPRSFAINRGYITQTDEPIDFNMDDTLPDSSSTPNKTREGIVFLSYAIGRPELSRPNCKGAHPCNGTDQNEAKYNRTTFLKISDEAVLFLKGLMVTRIMPSFYIFIILFSLPLNALALVMFTCKIRAKKPAVIYMSHLVCVDLLFTLLLPLKIHYQMNASDWVFGEVACRVLSAAYYCYMYCSILLMMCMSVDRLLAVVLPVASLSWRNAWNATCVCVLVWLLAIAGTVPILSIGQTFEIKDVGVTCHDALMHEDGTGQVYMYLFSILSCLYYFVPLFVTLVSYFTIIYVLSGKSNLLAKSASLSEKRKRAVIMVIAVLIEFVLCFAPTNGILLYHCVRLAGEKSGEADSSYAVYLVAVCLGSASVFLDPLLYYYGSSQCRQKIKSVFWWRRAKTNLSRTSTSTHTGSSFVSCEYSQASVSVKM